MRPAEIEAGQTYTNGTRARTVVELLDNRRRRGQRDTVVYTADDAPDPSRKRTCLVTSFARWATARVSAERTEGA